MKLECHIVRDLLPNYIDHLTCDDTNKDIEEHMASCEDCSYKYKEMVSDVPVKYIDPFTMNNNKKQVSYLKKCLRWIVILAVIVAILVTAIAIYAISINKAIFLLTEKEQKVYTSISDYEHIYGVEGKYKDEMIGYNNIFPDSIPESADVKDFYFEHSTSWDDSYLGLLVYSCDTEDFEREYQRLKEIDSSENSLIYSATGFPEELCAVYADEDYGYIYALADKDNNQFIYVDIQFCNYFADINYEEIIPQQYLPYGFDAKEGNATRLEFENNQ